MNKDPYRTQCSGEDKGRKRKELSSGIKRIINVGFWIDDLVKEAQTEKEVQKRLIEALRETIAEEQDLSKISRNNQPVLSHILGDSDTYEFRHEDTLYAIRRKKGKCYLEQVKA